RFWYSIPDRRQTRPTGFTQFPHFSPYFASSVGRYILRKCDKFSRDQANPVRTGWSRLPSMPMLMHGPTERDRRGIPGKGRFMNAFLQSFVAGIGVLALASAAIAQGSYNGMPASGGPAMLPPISYMNVAGT